MKSKWIRQQFSFLILVLAVLVGLYNATAHCQTKTFPEPPDVISPPDEAIVQYPGTDGFVFFSWTTVENATGYLINVVVNSKPAASVKTTDTSIYLDLNLTSNDSGALVSWSILSIQGTTVSSNPAISKFTFALEGTPIPTLVISPTPTPSPKPTSTPLPPPTLILPEDRSEFSALDQIILFDWSDVTGASGYKLTLYKNNEELLNRVVKNSTTLEQFQQQIYTVLQWDVRTIDSIGNLGYQGARRSFSIGGDFLPTPTPMPDDPDVDRNGAVNVLDIYQFAARYATNDPKVDLDHSGIITQSDLLKFIELFVTQE